MINKQYYRYDDKTLELLTYDVFIPEKSRKTLTIMNFTYHLNDTPIKIKAHITPYQPQTRWEPSQPEEVEITSAISKHSDLPFPLTTLEEGLIGEFALDLYHDR